MRVITTDVISEAEKLAESGNLQAAKSRIKAHIEYITNEAATISEANPLITQLHQELNSIESGLSSRASYEQGGAHYMQSRVLMHSKQRCAESSAVTMNTYRAKKKQMFASKMSRK